MHDAVTSQQLVELFGGVLGGGAAVALVAEIIKKVAGARDKAVIHTLVVILTVLAGVAQYVLTLKNVPAEVLGVSGVAIWGASQAFYKAVPAIVDFLNKTDAAEGSAAADAAVAAISAPTDITPADIAPAAPADGAPAEPATPPSNEFSA